MASSGERRMLFDTRGRRKHVIRVVYAILALLMGASLFLVVGPFNIANLIGNSSSTSSAAKVLHEQAERLEAKLAKSPDDPQLLLALTRARIGAGNAQIQTESEAELPTVTLEAKEDFKAASTSWVKYLKQTDEPNAAAAQLLAGSYFHLAESSTGLLEAEEYVREATKAQKIAVEQNPNLGVLSTLATYQYFNGEFDGGDATARRAAAKTGSKTEATSVEAQLAEFRKRGQKFAKQKKELAKVQKEVSKEKLENPLGGGLGGTGAGLGG